MKHHLQEVDRKVIFSFFFTKVLLSIKMTESLKWMMKAMERVNMNSDNEQQPNSQSFPADNNNVQKLNHRIITSNF
jgi:hypothetical protein